MTLPPELMRQYEALTRQVGVADLTGRTVIEVTGTDRAALLNSFCTNDVKQLAPGGGCEAFVLTPHGKTLGHVSIFNTGPSLLVETVPGQAERLIKHWSHYVISEDVNFRDLTGETAVLLVSGPDAPQLLYGLCTQELPQEVPSLAIPTIGGQPVRLCVVEYAGPRSFLVLVDRTAAGELAGAIDKAGATRCRAEAVEIARVEQGFPQFGQDITDDNLPQEINRNSQAISFKKGCYLGQETVARIDALGHVNRMLAGVKFSDESVPQPGTALNLADKEIGYVTSAVWSPSLGAPLALATVRRAQAKAGTLLSSSVGPGEVVTLPLALRGSQ